MHRWTAFRQTSPTHTDAEKALKRVRGVRGVANDIEVTLGLKRTDPEIARDALHELESHISIPSDEIKVRVKNAWVTLEGTLDWQYQISTISAPSTLPRWRGGLI
jgi:osmotically-inducible protein OsmY